MAKQGTKWDDTKCMYLYEHWFWTFSNSNSLALPFPLIHFLGTKRNETALKHLNICSLCLRSNLLSSFPFVSFPIDSTCVRCYDTFNLVGLGGKHTHTQTYKTYSESVVCVHLQWHHAESDRDNWHTQLNACVFSALASLKSLRLFEFNFHSFATLRRCWFFF